MGAYVDDTITLSTIIDELPESKRLFHSPPKKASTVTLSRARINRIVQYGGCFNPPHRGHLEVVESALYRSGVDYNVVGIVICTRDVDFLQTKYAGDDTLLLSQAQRRKIWKRAKLPSVWIYRGTDDDQESRTIKDIVAEGGQRGFSMEIVSAVGTDYFRFLQQPDNLWTRTLLVESRTRAGKKAQDSLTEPVQLTGFGLWSEVTTNLEELGFSTEAVFPHGQTPEEVKDALRMIRTSQAEIFSFRHVRLILAHGEPIESLSSSRLRLELQRNFLDEKALTTALENFVIAPKTTVEEILTYQRRKNKAMLKAQKKLDPLPSEDEVAESQSEG